MSVVGTHIPLVVAGRFNWRVGTLGFVRTGGNPLRRIDRCGLLVCAVAAVVFFSSCSSSSAPLAEVPAAALLVTGDLDFGSERRAIAFDTGAVQPAANGWATHELLLRASRSNADTILSVPPDSQAEDIEIGTTADSGQALLRFGDEPISFDVLIAEQLPPGSHEFEITLSYSLVPLNDEPTVEGLSVPLVLTYTVQSIAEYMQTRPYCETAIPVLDGRIPTLSEAQQLTQDAAQIEDHPLSESLIRALEFLESNVRSFEANPNIAISTFRVSSILENVCNQRLVAVEQEAGESE